MINFLNTFLSENGFISFSFFDSLGHWFTSDVLNLAASALSETYYQCKTLCPIRDSLSEKSLSEANKLC